MKKKLFSALLALTLVFMMVVPAFAAGTATIAVGNASGYVGDEVTVAVNLTQNSGVASAKITVNYDDTKLQLVSSSAGTVGFNVNGAVANLASSSGDNITATGTIMNVTFKILAAGSSTVSVTVNKFKDASLEEVSCTTTSGTVTGSEKPIGVESVSLDKNTLSLEKGGSATLTATVAPSNAATKTVTWASDNTAVATVNNGTVNAVGAGTANITVTTTDGGKTATCKVTVTAPVTGVTMSDASVYVGKTVQLTYSVSPSDASNKNVSFSSDNTSVATVSTTGVVTGVKAGTAKITVTTEDGSKKATCTVTVSEAPTEPATQPTSKAAEKTTAATKATEATKATDKTVEPTKATEKSTEADKTTEPTKAADEKTTEATKAADEKTTEATKATKTTKTAENTTEAAKTTQAEKTTEAGNNGNNNQNNGLFSNFWMGVLVGLLASAVTVIVFNIVKKKY